MRRIVAGAFASTTLAINATLYPKLPYDTVNDFAPIGIAARRSRSSSTIRFPRET